MFWCWALSCAQEVTPVPGSYSLLLGTVLTYFLWKLVQLGKRGLFRFSSLHSPKGLMLLGDDWWVPWSGPSGWILSLIPTLYLLLPGESEFSSSQPVCSNLGLFQWAKGWVNVY